MASGTRPSDELEQERRDLAAADQRLAQARERLEAQRTLVRHFQEAKLDTTEAIKLLRNFELLFEQAAMFREQIMMRITTLGGE